MALFNGRQSTTDIMVKIADVWIVQAVISPSCSDEPSSKGTLAPGSIRFFFAATLESGDYYELFSGMKLQKLGENHIECYFDTPYVKKADSLKSFLACEFQEEVTAESLNKLIVRLNAGYTQKFVQEWHELHKDE